jgi:sensor domain CHASE-containing protein
MLLRSKIVCILSVVVAAYAVTDYFVQRSNIYPSFLAVEREAAAEDMHRVDAAIKNQVKELASDCLHWSSWNDTYEFIVDGNEQFIVSNLGPNTIDNQALDLLFLCDAEGNVAWSDIRDPLDGSSMRLRDFPLGALNPTHPMLISARVLEESEQAQRNGNTSAKFTPGALLITEFGPMLLASRVLKNSEGEGPPRGTVIVGRFLRGKLLDNLCEQTKVDFEVWPLLSPEMPAIDQSIIDQATSSTEPVFQAADEEMLYVYKTIEDHRSQPALLVRASVDRKISQTGTTALSYALNSTVAAALFMLLVLGALIQKIVLKPISILTSHAVAIGQTDDLETKLKLERTDEVGILSREFDDMVGKLAESRQEVVRAARTAGMSQIATGILHNVGNVLNSVNVSATLVGQKVKKLGVGDLHALADVLGQQEDLGQFVNDDPRGQHLQPFIKSLAKGFSTDQASIHGEIESLSTGIAHIRDLISSQQNYAGQSSLVEWTSIPNRIDEALDMCNKALSTDNDLHIVRDFGEIPRLRIDKHKLLEILVNLIQNARHAMQANDPPVRRLTIRAEVIAEGELRISVSDNGMGIDAENMPKVFNMGFTTKSSGHGFGLHTSANAATEMGGSLAATSDGVSQGANFILEVPFQTETIVSQR